MEVTPCLTITSLICSRYSAQGAPVAAKSAMSPVPETVRSPAVLRLQVRASPQEPEAVSSVSVGPTGKFE